MRYPSPCGAGRAAAGLVALLLSLMPAAAADLPKPLVTGLKNPESIAVSADGRVFVSVIGEFDKDGDGAILQIADGKATPFVSGLDDPKGLVAFQGRLFVTDKTRVYRIDARGKKDEFVPAKAFPKPPVFLNDLEIDAQGNLYVSDSGDLKGSGAVYRVNPRGQVSLLVDSKRLPALKGPNGLLLDGESFLLVLDAGTGELHRVKISDGSATKVADGFGMGDGLAWDKYGRLYVTDHEGGRVFVIGRPGDKPVLLRDGFQSAADLCLAPNWKQLLLPDMKAGTVVALAAQVPGQEVDETPLPLESAVAFPKLKWTGWKGVTDAGLQVPLRPIVLTHAGDGSNRVFVATQRGVIHTFPNDQDVEKTTIYLDIQDRVRYDDKTNEEGFLGLAFHPDYKKNGELFAFYTRKKADHPHTNVVSRFRVSRDDPGRADPASEEVLLTITHRFWNHDGGTICFGPDGYLYVALGDGGLANDPDRNGQNLKNILGKVLRLDVNRKDDGKMYGIPKDNPFVGRTDVAPEIFAYGLRNVWRMAFDRKTGELWAGEVGQNLYEEINILKSGGNYGWNIRESLHPFGSEGVGPRKDLIDPVWEYHHDVGKSITGGHVYRGKRLPELDGSYLYADYVSAKIWALRYDEAKGRVVANRTIKDRKLPVLSFGEDEQGEVYYMTYTLTGQGLFWFVPTAKR